MDAVANHALDYYVKGEAFAQTIQDKPLLAALRAKQKGFAGGKGGISVPVKGAYLDADPAFFKGYSFNDTVTFQNPALGLRAKYNYFEIHGGITITFTELKQGGITVVDSAFGEKTAKAEESEIIELTNLLDDKLDSMAEGWSRKMNQMSWMDGTQDSAKQSPGILAFISDTPTLGTLGGLSRVTYSWWRNRVALGIVAGSDTLTKKLRSEVRQLRRYGGKPNLILAGSAFIEALEAEVVAKSTYSESGVSGKRDLASPSLFITGIGEIRYDPTLDDLQGIIGGGVDYSKRCYFIDTDSIGFRVMNGEDNKIHCPARPETQYAMYRSMTWTGGMIAKRLNSSGVYSIS